MPVVDGLWAHEQPDSPWHVARQAVEHSGEDGPISWDEPRPLTLQLSLEDGDLVA